MAKKIFLLLVFFILSVGRAEALSLRQKMDVEIGIFDAARIEFSFQSDKQQFDIATEVKTANLFDTLYPFYGKYNSLGKIKVIRILPEVYQTYTKTRHHIRTKKILYDIKGRGYKRISSKDEKISEAAITNVPISADAADLQSVFADLMNIFWRTQSCQLEREVYDGKKHYKVIVKNDGQEKSYFSWRQKEENAYRCLVYIENLRDNNDNILWEVSADKPIKLWIGQDERTKMLFVLQIVIDSTPLGMLQVTPTMLEIK